MSDKIPQAPGMVRLFPVKLPFASLDQSYLMFATDYLGAGGVPCCLNKPPPP